MTKTQLRWMISLMTLAALAVVGLQAYIWQQSIAEEREQFSERVRQAVLTASQALIKQDLPSMIEVDQNVFRIQRDSLHRTGTFQVMLIDSLGTQHPEWMSDFSHEKLDSLRGVITVRAESRNRSITFGDSTSYVTMHSTPPNVVREGRFAPSIIVSSSFTSMTDSFEPILSAHLSQNGISGDFDWGVHQAAPEAWLAIQGDTAAVQASTWRFPMFNFAFAASARNLQAANVLSPPTLALNFPDENWRILRGVAITLIASGLLALLVIGCLAYALYLIVRQKRLAEVKTDFINNMTHEFKTPISTIALACEALQDDSVRHTPDLQTRYTAMIASENDRLATQVEKVLQMALLDRNDLGLKMEPVDLHTILREVESAFSMQVNQRGGQLTTTLEATPAVVTADGLHLRQMLTNLLDNANKYSPESPTIHILTRNRADGVEIAVRDHGIGIHREALRKVFDRFYRVPTGNRHDVKGFGLGLAYVHTMALAHGGQIRATSTPGRGSTFTLYLPYAHA
ncbi:MAG: hypothetical protein RhofKO_16140 [Rhodothermales bacterium]